MVGYLSLFNEERLVGQPVSFAGWRDVLKFSPSINKPIYCATINDKLARDEM